MNVSCECGVIRIDVEVKSTHARDITYPVYEKTM